jgi:hypothetical protein
MVRLVAGVEQAESAWFAANADAVIAAAVAAAATPDTAALADDWRALVAAGPGDTDAQAANAAHRQLTRMQDIAERGNPVVATALAAATERIRRQGLERLKAAAAVRFTLPGGDGAGHGGAHDSGGVHRTGPAGGGAAPASVVPSGAAAGGAGTASLSEMEHLSGDFTLQGLFCDALYRACGVTFFRCDASGTEPRMNDGYVRFENSVSFPFEFDSVTLGVYGIKIAPKRGATFPLFAYNPYLQENRADTAKKPVFIHATYYTGQRRGAARAAATRPHIFGGSSITYTPILRG